MKEYIAKLSKRETKYFIYYNYGNLSTKNKDEVYLVLNQHTPNSLWLVYRKQNNLASTPESMKRLETIRSQTDVKGDTLNHYDPK